MIKFPQKPGDFKQIGTSDVLGNIWSSFNLDLTTNLGRMRGSPRGMYVTNSEDQIHLGVPTAFVMYRDGNNDRIWALAGDRLFRNAGNPNNAFVPDSTGSSPTTLGDGSDMELFNGAIYVMNAVGGTLLKYNGAWSTVSSAPNGGNCQFCVYAGRLYFTQGDSQIGSVDLADAVSEPSGTPNTIAYTIDLKDFGVGGSSANSITSIRASSNRIWITTIDNTSLSRSAGRLGKIFEWDGVSTQANKVYYLDSIGALALIVKGDIPYAVDADGKLLQFNGREFAEVARLPIPPSAYLNNPTSGTPTQRFIHPRGISLRNGRILMFINNILEISGAIVENLPSGVWEYDESMGLYHKYSVSQWQNGFTETRSDYGQNRLKEIGALFSAKSTSSSNSLNGDLLMGAQYYKYVSTPTNAIFINDTQDTAPKVSYFVTTKIDSQNVNDIWQKAYLTYKQLLDSSDRIVLKYRTTEQPPTEVLAEWTSSSTFTTATNLAAYAIGDEVEITSGPGSGQVEHIVNIVLNGGIWTIALENSVIGAASQSMARFQKWRKAGTVSNQQTDYDQLPIETNSSWIQLKCVMYFTGIDEFNYLQLINKTDIKPI